MKDTHTHTHTHTHTMKSTKKMVLIPFEKYTRLIQNEADASNKAPTSVDERDTVDAIEPTPMDTIEHEDSSALDDENILQMIPKHLRNSGKLVLNFLHRQKAITWDRRGQIAIEGKPVPLSHISDMIRDALVEYKRYTPTGFEQFYSHLNGIPITLIKNPSRRELIRKGRGIDERELAREPPPGMPDKKPAITLYKNSSSSESNHLKNKPKGGKTQTRNWVGLWKVLR